MESVYDKTPPQLGASALWFVIAACALMAFGG